MVLVVVVNEDTSKESHENGPSSSPCVHFPPLSILTANKHLFLHGYSDEYREREEEQAINLYRNQCTT